MNINWKVRFNKKNILFIVQVFMSVAVPVLAYFGLNASDMTSWGMVWNTIIDAVSNPYVVGLMAVSAFNAITDPTTSGIKDSDTALTYINPKK